MSILGIFHFFSVLITVWKGLMIGFWYVFCTGVFHIGVFRMGVFCTGAERNKKCIVFVDGRACRFSAKKVSGNIGNWTRWQWLRSMVLAPQCSISGDLGCLGCLGTTFSVNVQLSTCSYLWGWSSTGPLVVDLCLGCLGFRFDSNAIFFLSRRLVIFFKNCIVEYPGTLQAVE